jgi:hypothetical protein
MVVSIVALTFTYIWISSLNISWSTGSTTAGVPVAAGALGLVGAGTLSVRMAVQM